MANSPTQPVPGIQQKRLGVFLGRWHTTGDIAATPSTPAARVDSIDTYEWYPGDFFLVHHVDAKVGETDLKSLEILGYDAKHGRYSATYFDSTGGSGTEELRCEGNTWTWYGANVMGVKHHRCIAVVSDDGNRIHARHEQSDDGKRWEPWMDVTLDRQH